MDAELRDEEFKERHRRNTDRTTHTNTHAHTHTHTQSVCVCVRRGVGVEGGTKYVYTCMGLCLLPHAKGADEGSIKELSQRFLSRAPRLLFRVC